MIQKTQRELLNDAQFVEYLTENQIKMIAKKGNLTTNSRNALIRSLEQDYIVSWIPSKGRKSGYFELDKREKSLPIYKRDGRYTRGKTDAQVAILDIFSNYVTKLKEKNGNETISMTKYDWLISADLIDAKFSKPALERVGYSKTYINLLDKHITDYYFNQLQAKGLGFELNLKYVIKNNENKKVLNESENSRIIQKREELKEKGLKYSNYRYKDMLSEKGEQELKAWINEEFDAVEHWLEYELDLKQVKSREIVEVDADAIDEIWREFREYRTTELIKLEYKTAKELYGYPKEVLFDLLNAKYFNRANKLDEKLGIGETDIALIESLRAKYEADLWNKTSEQISKDLDKETIEIFKDSFIEAYLTDWLKKEHKQEFIFSRFDNLSKS